ncbi:unnamed protein product [Effrenium voratum]|nr:unnamed protein product [Effrenium voratum]
MGFLEEATPMPWGESTHHHEALKASAVEQFLQILRDHEARKDPEMLWGDEQEYALVEVGPDTSDVRLMLRANAALEQLRKRAESYKASPATCALWSPEMGNHMVEGVTKPPYGSGLDEILLVQASLAFRRRELAEVAASLSTSGWRGVVWTFANFPLLGTAAGQAPAEPATPDREDGLGSCSRFVPDEVITPHPRFLAFVANIRTRKGAKTAAFLPLAANADGKPARTQEPPSPWQLEELEDTDDPVAGRIYLDAAAFGAGSCCTQATCLCPSLSDARYLYDQLLVLAPLFLPLTASSPFWRGMIAATDTRIEAFRETWDDRTVEETRQQAPRNSRAATSPQVFLADSGPLLTKDYNDVDVAVHEPSLQRLLAAGVDVRLARHVAQLFVRDPLNVFRERLELDNATVGDHWEQLQSSNWGTVRFKPPPARASNPRGEIGWRVELRTAQATDFENAAVVAIARVLAEVILEERWDLYMQISRVEQNLERSGGVGAVCQQRFFFRADFLGRGGAGGGRPYPDTSAAPESRETGDSVADFSLEEILFSKLGVFTRCVSFMQQQHREGKCSDDTLKLFSSYVELFRRRTRGELPTPAAWLRRRLANHPAYQGGPELPGEFVRDMATLASSLSETPRSVEAAAALEELLGDLAAFA